MDGKTLKLNFDSARLLTVRLNIILPRFVKFGPELKEIIPDNENVRYVYYNKIDIAPNPQKVLIYYLVPDCLSQPFR